MDLESKIEEKRQALESHRKKFDKASTSLCELKKWLDEYEKLVLEFEEVYQKKHQLPDKEYAFKTPDGHKFRGKFQEASSLNINKRTYQTNVLEDNIKFNKEQYGSRED
jgi:hypothetical protein